MALSTHSKFIYGLEVTKDNMFIEWREGLTLYFKKQFHQVTTLQQL